MIHRMIDHTLLKTDATAAQIEALCKEAKEYHFASVCVSPCHVRQAAELVKGTDVRVCTVIGFPQGANRSAVKAFETEQAVRDGADEVDMVINVGALKAGDTEVVQEDISAVVQNAGGALVKVIIECCLLSDEEKRRACLLAKEAGAHYVKTSTGMSTGGATVHDVELMRETVGEGMGVKAAGGIRDYETAKAMIDVGATRIGTSNGAKIVQESL